MVYVVYVVIFRVIVMLKYLSRTQYTKKLFKKLNKMQPMHFTSMPNLRGPTAVSANQSKENIFNDLSKRIEDKLTWNLLVCKDGNTQKKERIYIPVINEAIRDLRGEFDCEA